MAQVPQPVNPVFSFSWPTMPRYRLEHWVDLAMRGLAMAGLVVVGLALVLMAYGWLTG